MTDPQSGNAAPARRNKVVWLINLTLLAILVGVLVWTGAATWRRANLYFTGRVSVEGAYFYLHPGDTYLTQSVLHLGEYEPMETRLVRERLQEGDVFLDVGANIGWYTVLASTRVGAGGKVIAFEPDPANAVMLRRNVEANGLTNVVVEEKALSNEPGKLKLFLDRKNLGRHSVVLKYDDKDYVEVETLRLDDYWKDGGDIRLVKIDTEGAEGFILDGMRQTLEKHPRLELILEFAPERLEKAGYDPDEVLDRLYRLGFKVTLIDEVRRRFVEMGTPKVKDFGFVGEDPYINLHLKR